MLTLSRAYPEYVPVEDLTLTDRTTGKTQAYTGSYSLGFTSGNNYPTPDSLIPGPVLSSQIPAGTWVVWLSVTDNPEHPIIPLGRIDIV